MLEIISKSFGLVVISLGYIKNLDFLLAAFILSTFSISSSILPAEPDSF